MRIANLNERGDEPEKGSSRRRSRSMWTFSTREVMTIAVVILLVVALPRLINRFGVRTDSKSHPGQNLTELVPRGPLYLVQLGDGGTVDLEAFRDECRRKFGLDVTVLPPLPLDASDFDANRDQFVAERVAASMREHLPDVAADPKATVIGVMERDMYIASSNWTYAFSWRNGHGLAVVSIARMASNDTPSSGADLPASRLRKMLTKNIGLLVYGLPVSGDPTSVLYDNVGGVEELDVMTDNFEGAGPRSTPVAGMDISYPCFIVSPVTNWDGQMPVSGRVDRCMPGLHTERRFDEIEIDLRYGGLITRHTDLFRADSMPLALMRGYYIWDEVSRAFGIGGNHPYDVLPVGGRNPYTYVDLIMPDGRSIHYDRISKGFGFSDAIYEHHAPTGFFGSRFSWNGAAWDLRFRDGSLFLFPENYSGSRNNHGAPFAMQDGAGNKIVFLRDSDRNLIRLMSPSGYFFHFEYDDGHRVRQVTDDEGRVVQYEYDDGGRLVLASDATRHTRYAYEDAILSRIGSDETGTLIDIMYRNKRVSSLAFANGQRFQFSYVGGDAGPRAAARTEITDEKGVKTAVPIAP